MELIEEQQIGLNLDERFVPFATVFRIWSVHKS